MSQGVTIDTLSFQFLITNPTANVTASSFTQPVPKTSTPSGDGVIPFGAGGSIAASGLLLVPYGVGTDNTAFLMNVFGWREVFGTADGFGAAGQQTLWIPVCLATFTGCTLDSALPGLSNTPLGTTQLLCSAVTLGVGNANVSVEVVSPGHAAHQVAHVLLQAKGFKFLEVQFSTNSAVTSCNALYAKL